MISTQRTGATTVSAITINWGLSAESLLGLLISKNPIECVSIRGVPIYAETSLTDKAGHRALKVNYQFSRLVDLIICNNGLDVGIGCSFVCRKIVCIASYGLEALMNREPAPSSKRLVILAMCFTVHRAGP